MTTYAVVNEANYSAQVVRVRGLLDLPGLDNLVGLPWAGLVALVPKSTQVGDLLAVFPAETQLSDAFVSAHNLYRHAEKNADPQAKGYLDDNRRVRAIRLRGNTSSALAMPLNELGWDIPEGSSFDTVDGVEVCRKYYVPIKGTGLSGKSAQEKVWRRVDEKFLPEHPDTENYFRNHEKIADDEFITVSQKLHGTSIRIGHTLVKVKPSWRTKVARWLGLPVKDHEFAHVYGSRKVIKDPNNPDQMHFYKDDSGRPYDIWTAEGQKYDDLIPKNVLVFGELIGWTASGAPIQSNYTYQVPQGEAHLYVYRVAVVTEDGLTYDLPWEAMEQFCFERAMNVVPLLWRGRKGDFDPALWIDKTYWPTFPSAVPLAKESPCDEGVVVRKCGILPLAMKVKSPLFLEFETKNLDRGESDIESVQSAGVQ